MMAQSPGRWKTTSRVRRLPGSSPLSMVACVAAASLLPICVMAGGFTAAAVLTGLVVGALATTLTAAAVATAVCGVSLVCHESAHLIALRVLTRGQVSGAVEHSWANVWVVAPDLAFPVRNLVGLAGPLAGMTFCWLVSVVGAASWICWLVGVVHAANLVPLTPDGAAIWSVRRAAR